MSDKRAMHEGARWPDTIQVTDGGNPNKPELTPAWLRSLASEPAAGSRMVPISPQTLRDIADRLEKYERGWTEAAIAWEACASIHRAYAKGRDAVYTTCQGDYVRHAADARAHVDVLRG